MFGAFAHTASAGCARQLKQIKDSKQEKKVQLDTGSCKREAMRSQDPMTWSSSPGPALSAVFAVGERRDGPHQEAGRKQRGLG